MSTTRKVILYIAASLDGFIAGPDGDMHFLDPMDKEGEDYGYGNFIASVDTVILGRKTYDWVMAQVDQFPHHDKRTFIVTRTPKPAIGNITFYTGNLAELIAELRKENGKNIFCDGGAEVVNVLLRERLVDEIYLAVIPVCLGGGVRLFQTDTPHQQLHLLGTRSFDTGLVQLHYRVQH